MTRNMNWIEVVKTYLFICLFILVTIGNALYNTGSKLLLPFALVGETQGTIRLEVAALGPLFIRISGAAA